MEVQKFEFTDYMQDVEIAGNKFRLDCGSETGDYLRTVSRESQRLLEDWKEGTKSDVDIVGFCWDAINHLLGDKAAEQIFVGRKATVSDVCDVLTFLSGVVTRFSEEHRQQLLRGTAPANRAQRRAATKNK